MNVLAETNIKMIFTMKKHHVHLTPMGKLCNEKMYRNPMLVKLCVFFHVLQEGSKWKVQNFLTQVGTVTINIIVLDPTEAGKNLKILQ